MIKKKIIVEVNLVLQSIILLLKAMLEMSNGDNGSWFGVVDVRRFGFCW